MEAEIIELERKYIEHFVTKESNMSKQEAQEYLGYIRKHPHLEFAETRTERLERYLDALMAKESYEEKRQKRNTEVAVAYRDLTNKWIELGANWRSVGPALTVWEHKGERFFKWWSGSNASEVLAVAKQADKELFRIIERLGAN